MGYQRRVHGEFDTDNQPANMYKVILASAIVAIAAAATPYAAKPDPYDAAPEAFAYQYGVADDYSSTNFKKEGNQDEYGNVAGSLTIALPDGRIQTTRYTATHEGGFVADVTYEGTPHYPEAKAYAPKPAPYHAPKPVYAPKPAPYHA